MTFTADELKDRFRKDVDDVEGGSGGEDYLFSDDEVLEYMYEAQREFVRRARVLRKTSPFAPTVTEITITPPADPLNLALTDGWITPHASIIKPLRARLRSQVNPRNLELVTVEEMDGGYWIDDYGTYLRQNWESQTGPARFIITNMQEDQWRLVPIPVVADTLELTVLHMPTTDVTQGAELEVTEREDQLTLMLYMKYLAFMKQDADIYDKELSDRFLNAFEKKADDRRREVRQTRFRHQGMRYGGIEF